MEECRASSAVVPGRAASQILFQPTLVEAVVPWVPEARVTENSLATNQLKTVPLIQKFSSPRVPAGLRSLSTRAKKSQLLSAQSTATRVDAASPVDYQAA